MKATLPPLVIAKPCTASWAQMTGDERRRYCDLCGLHVHNLSAMTEREQRAFATANGTRECIAYVPLPNGRIIAKNWRDSVRRFFRPLRWALASIAPVLFSACANRDHPRPIIAGGPMPPDNHKTYRGGDDTGAPLLGMPGPVPGKPMPR